MTGFRRVQEVIAAAGIPDGPHAGQATAIPPLCVNRAQNAA